MLWMDACSINAKLRWNSLPHSAHMNGFSLLWMTWCSMRLELRGKLLPHCWHEWRFSWPFGDWASEPWAAPSRGPLWVVLSLYCAGSLTTGANVPARRPVSGKFLPEGLAVLLTPLSPVGTVPPFPGSLLDGSAPLSSGLNGRSRQLADTGHTGLSWEGRGGEKIALHWTPGWRCLRTLTSAFQSD